MATAVYDRSKINLTAVKKYLRLDLDDASEDSDLKRALASAKRAVDSYCSNPFEDEDGNELDIPEDVEEWILRRVASRYSYREGGVSSLQLNGIGSVGYNKDDLQELFPHWKPFL